MISESDVPMHGWAPYHDVHYERLRAHEKHGAAGHSCEQVSASDPEWIAILGEEFGEVCHELTYDSGSVGHYERLRKELVQVAAMACAWIDAIDGGRF